MTALFHQSLNIIAHSEEEESQKNGDSHGLYVVERFFRKFSSAHALDKSQDEDASVQKGDGEKVQEAQVQAEEGDEEKEGEEASVGYLGATPTGPATSASWPEIISTRPVTIILSRKRQRSPPIRKASPKPTSWCSR